MESIPFSSADLWALAPELIVTIGASIVLLYGALEAPRRNPVQFAWIPMAAGFVRRMTDHFAWSRFRARELSPRNVMTARFAQVSERKRLDTSMRRKDGSRHMTIAPLKCFTC